jgi:hypothetical protein
VWLILSLCCLMFFFLFFFYFFKSLRYLCFVFKE